MSEGGVAAAGTEPQVYVIVPVFDRIENLPRLYRQLADQTYRSFRLVLVDHGNRHAETAALPDFAVHLLGSPDLWWSGAVNIGLRYVLETANAGDDDYVLLQNDDVVFGPDLVEGLVAASIRERAIVSAITLELGTEQILDAHNRLSLLRARHCSPLKGAQLSSVVSSFLEADVLKGRGTLYPVLAVRAIGYADEGLHYRADPEYSYRARKAGWRLGVVPTVAVEAALDTQRDAQRGVDRHVAWDYLWSKRSTQNLPAAWRYFRRCFGLLAAVYCIVVHSIRCVLILTYRAAVKREH